MNAEFESDLASFEFELPGSAWALPWWWCLGPKMATHSKLVGFTWDLDWRAALDLPCTPGEFRKPPSQDDHGLHPAKGVNLP